MKYYLKNMNLICLLTCTMLIFVFIFGCDNKPLCNVDTNNSEIRKIPFDQNPHILEESYEVTYVEVGEGVVNGLQQKMRDDYSDEDRQEEQEEEQGVGEETESSVHVFSSVA